MTRFTLIISMLLLVTSQRVQAQCSPCTPVFSTCPPTGGLCSHLDTAYANHPYDKQINFYMPKTLNDPSILALCQCSQVNLRVINVTGVSNLPGGINYVLNNGGHYDVQNGDSVGCAHFCGTPRVPGMYAVVVHLLADVTAIGTPIGNVNQNNNAQQYYDTLIVLPDTVPGVSSFTYGNNGSSACDSITISLNALYTTTSPNFARYFWNIAGQVTEDKTPGSFTFTNQSQTHPDTFPVTLTTVFYNYIVKKVHIAVITGGYCGDIEEVTCSCISGADSPDPYVKFNSLGFNNEGSAGSNTCRNINFDNLNIPVPLGTQTIDMEMWDIDTRTPIIGSPDDLLGTYTLNVVWGQRNFSNNNADGYVEFDTVAGSVITETLNVIVSPYPVYPTVIVSQDTLCSTDSIRISIDNAYSGCSFEWYRDTVFLSEATDSVFYSNKAGNYKVKITNIESGCQSESDFKKVTMMQSPPSIINVVFNGTSSFPNPFPSSGFSVDWFYQGNLVTTNHGKFLPYLGDGLYEAQVFNTLFPACRTIANSRLVSTGIDGPADNFIYDLSIFPNPNSGKFVLSFTSETAQFIDIRIQNLLAQTVYQKKLENHTGDFSEEIELSRFSKGIYMATIETEKGKLNKKVVIQ